MDNAKNQIKKYLLLLFLISDGFFLTTILLINLKLATYPDFLTVIFGMCGILTPTVIALVLNKVSFKSFFKYTFSHKKNTFKYFCLFFFLYLFIYISTRSFDKEFPLILILPLFLYASTFGGGFEEYGWRGLLQPNLEKIFPFSIAALITGIIWGFWHIPIWVIQGMELNFNVENLFNFLIFIFGCIKMSFILGYVYYKTNSVFYCSLIHGLHNTLSLFFITNHSLLPAIINEVLSLFIVVLTLILYKKDKKNNL